MTALDMIEKRTMMTTTTTKGLVELNYDEKAMATLAKKKKRHCHQKKRVTHLQKKRRIPWAVSQGLKLLINYAPKTKKSFDLGKVICRILQSKPLV